MLNRSEYQPISQLVDDDEADVTEPVPSSSASRPRRSSIPRKIDLRKLDNAFKRCVSWDRLLWSIPTLGCRWTESIAQKMKRKKKTEDLNARKEVWRSVFEPYVPPSHGDLGYVSYHPTPEASDLTDLPAQTKTLDHRPPMSQAEFDASVTSTLNHSTAYRPQFGSRC